METFTELSLPVGLRYLVHYKLVRTFKGAKKGVGNVQTNKTKTHRAQRHGSRSRSYFPAAELLQVSTLTWTSTPAKDDMKDRLTKIRSDAKNMQVRKLSKDY